MCFAGWPITVALCCLFGSATSLPYTPAPSLTTPFPTHIPPEHSHFPSSFEKTIQRDNCHLKMSPSALVVRFGDPVQVNCSTEGPELSMLGWAASQGASEVVQAQFLVWSVERTTDWSMNASCFKMSDQPGSCNVELPLVVYQPPARVSIRFLNHTGPLIEGHRHTLQCTVQDVAPVENVIVIFYRGQTALGQVKSCGKSRTPVNESFSLSITPCRQDNGSRYWCEATLELGPEGPVHPPVVTSQNLTALVFLSPQLVQTQLQLKETSKCQMKGNPTLFGSSGTTNCCRKWFLLAALLCQIIIQL